MAQRFNKGKQGTNNTRDQCAQRTGNSERPEASDGRESEALCLGGPPRKRRAGLEPGEMGPRG